MNLTAALQVQSKEVIAFVGGGGKTTAMFRLAQELAAQGKRVITTTTTRIFASQIQLAPRHIFVTDADEGLEAARTALRAQPHILLIGAATDEGKALGIAPELAARLIALDAVDAVLVEADGSRMRPFKAPAEHEPVIPAVTTLLVPVVGIDAVGAPLDSEHVHRAERAAALLGVPLGAILTPAHLAAVITHPQGGLQFKPPHARVTPLINKVENAERQAAARDLAWRMLAHASIGAVAVGAVKDAANPVREVWQRAGAVILAAGGSTRMGGSPKQLLPWGEGTLVRHAVRVARSAPLADVVLVTGNRAPEVAAQAQGLGARAVYNPDWATGIASSVRTGIQALAPNCAAALFINADQPFLTADVIETILRKYAETLAPIVVPVYDGKRGSPVLVVRALFDEWSRLEGDRGGRALLDKHAAQIAEVEIRDAQAGWDIDTPEEYRTAVAQRAHKDM